MAARDPFDFNMIREEMEEFARTIPGLLLSHPVTSDLSLSFSDIIDSASNPFTVAVVGQMRVGKSTLLNALIGKDLAITGVNETTATLNWLKHGEGGLLDHFRVIWKDKPEELLPKSQISEWIGNSDKAKSTKFLEFYSDSPVLLNANFVDTPGMRSVFESHEEAINDFLANRLHEQSQNQGSRADAIVYVFPQTGRETDQARLEQFAESRIPGSSPMNSIGVMHKWDAIDESDPFEVVERKSAAMKEVMADLVSEVIPVSAPLHIAADRFDDSFWQTVSTLSTIENEEDYEDLLLDEREFISIDLGPDIMSHQDRATLRKNYPIPWPSLQLIINHLRKKSFRTSEECRQEIHLRSGIPLLQKRLQERFFSRSRIIKVLSLVNRAWLPCSKALIRLRNEKRRLAEHQKEIPELIYAVGSANPNNESHRNLLNKAKEFIAGQEQQLKESFSSVSALLRIIDEKFDKVKTIYEAIDGDLACLMAVDNHELSFLSPQIQDQLKAVFGFYGNALADRLSPWSELKFPEAVIEALEELINQISSFQSHHKHLGFIQHAQFRIETLLDCLEQGNFQKLS